MGEKNEQDDGGKFDLDVAPEEERKIEERTSVGVIVVHEAIRREGEAELARPTAALAWSGLAAGLSMGFSLVAEGLLRFHLPDAPWRPLVAKLGYSVGFLIVILGRQQLFTENTLTVILPLLYRRNLETVIAVARLWGVVLATNILGVWLFALALRDPVFEPGLLGVFRDIGLESMAPGTLPILLKGIFAGWLIALMVWLLPASEGGRVPTIVIITYLVGLGKMSHIIAGSVETIFLATSGEIPYLRYLSGYMLPALAGNVIGGIALVAALNHAQVVAGRRRKA